MNLSSIPFNPAPSYIDLLSPRKIIRLCYCLIFLSNSFQIIEIILAAIYNTSQSGSLYSASSFPAFFVFLSSIRYFNLALFFFVSAASYRYPFFIPARELNRLTFLWILFSLCVGIPQVLLQGLSFYILKLLFSMVSILSLRFWPHLIFKNVFSMVKRVIKYSRASSTLYVSLIIFLLVISVFSLFLMVFGF